MTKTKFPVKPKVLYWTLDGHTPVPATHMEWAAFFSSQDRVLANWMLDNIQISTVFLGLDHSFGVGPPVLFETMIFNDEGDDEYQERYTSWDAAMEGHARAVAHVISKGWPKKKEVE